MAESVQEQSNTTLRLTRTVAAPRERVWNAWTQPDGLRKWHHPGPDAETVIAEVDLRVGGRYRLGMKPNPNDATVHVATGIYQEITPESRLVFTWNWEEGEGHTMECDTLVTIELVSKSAATEVVLTHERFPNPERCAQHEDGWGKCLGQLSELE